MPAQPRRGLLALALTATCALGAGTGAAQAAPDLSVNSPECQARGVPGTLASYRSWTEISSCEWSADYTPSGLGTDHTLESRSSVDGGATWSEASAVTEALSDPQTGHMHAVVQLEAEGVQRVQFRTVAGDGERGSWQGDDYARVDRSPPVVLSIDPLGPDWAPQGSEGAHLRVSAADALSGGDRIDVRLILARTGTPPGAGAAWWEWGGCGQRYSQQVCRTTYSDAGLLEGDFAALAGDWFVSVRACDRLWICGPWSDPVRKRVAMRDGAASSRLNGTPGADVIDAGAGADRVDANDGDDRILAGPGADTVSTGAGSDTVIAGSGADRVNGGPGPDSVWGGPGADVIDVSGGGRDRVDCGPGRDVVRADRRDRVARNCERVIRS